MEKKVKAHVQHHILQVLCVFLLVAFLALMLAVEFQRRENVVLRESAQAVELVQADRAAGYVFRNETTVTDLGQNGVLHYLQPDGAAVCENDAVLEAYGISREQNERERASALYAEIAYLEQALAGGDSFDQRCMEGYMALMQSSGAGDWQNNTDAAERFATALQQLGVVVGGDADAIAARIAALRAEIDEIVEYAGGPMKVTATEDGYFCYQVDGYEANFGLSACASLTPEQLDTLLTLNNVPARVVGKVVSGERFCLAVPLSGAEAACYVAGNTYTVRMVRGGECEMLLERIALSATGDRALLMLTAEQMPAGMDFARRQPVEILRGAVSGINVPDTALCSENGESFVYVVENGTAQRRRVEVLLRQDGCCILAFRNEENYLRAGELVLLDAAKTGIFEGMVLSK